MLKQRIDNGVVMFVECGKTGSKICFFVDDAEKRFKVLKGKLFLFSRM